MVIFSVYAVRHFIFSLAVLLGHLKNDAKPLRGRKEVVVPCRNEEHVITRLLDRLSEFQIQNRALKIHIIDDGSTDKTPQILNTARKHWFPTLNVLTRTHNPHGKPQALKDALTQLTGDIAFFYDADYVPQWNTLNKLCQFKTPQHGAIQGFIMPFEGNWLQNTFVLERLASYRVNLYARQLLNLSLQIGGTNCAIKRSVLQKLGGFSLDSLAEDTDFGFRMLLSGYKVQYEPLALSFEVAADSLKRYWRQHYRWSFGHQQCALKYSVAVLKSGFLNVREKIDAFLVLQTYFLPVLVGFGWALAILAFLLGQPTFLPLWFSIAYLTIGNTAPLTEILTGLYLEKKVQWGIKYLPFIFFLNIVNVAISVNAVLNLLLRRKQSWKATGHL